ncbi:hypothetical protein HAX54_045733 [Datura stramonium]|uniref:Uncharacterized protein n=1 Tax=Datura stramonium TaxID=4076 RepID=A0ABS8SQE4_DATST|nr:hypothetical protein [Datura stramonium]
MLACHNNHHDDLDSVGSQSKKVEEEEVNYKLRYDPRGLDMIKTKEPEGLHGPVLSISENNMRIDNILSHLYGIVGPGFEEPFDDDDPTDSERARCNSDLESNVDDSEIGEAIYAPTDDED